VPACATPPVDAPVLRLTLVGSGERLLRLEKRLRCAAASLGFGLDLDIRKDSEALGILYADTPALLRDGQLVFSGLPRTEAIEGWLRHAFASPDHSHRDGAVGRQAC
jgi:hypothetical protein